MTGANVIESENECYVAADSGAWREQAIRVSGVLIAYNQEPFIRSAVEGILAQTYPLEIIIADDASTDGTFSVIEAVVANHPGPHRIRLLRARRNRGICGNQNAALSLAEGELIVLFEGDDVSLPERTTKLVNAYRGYGRAVGALGSAIRRIDSNGELIGEVTWPVIKADASFLARGKWTVAGCGLVIRRDCFFDVGPITRQLISGDIAMWMRAVFVHDGGVAFVPQALVDYRIHGNNASAQISKRYASRAALRASCEMLLKNEVAQVIELKKIARYRIRRSLSDTKTDMILSQMLGAARSRAALTYALARKPCRKWFLPAVTALRYRGLRLFALRAAALGLCPFAYRIYLAVKGRPFPKGRHTVVQGSNPDL